MILCSYPLAQYLSHKTEIDQAVSRVLDSGRYILGQEVELFEKEFAEFVGVPFAVGVGSGTEALHLALKTCGVGPGDEVITVSHTAVATVSAISLCQATPVLVDIEPDYFTLDPTKLKKAITPKTKAIIPVHLYGLPADLKPIMEIARARGIRVIEDASQAHGAWYGDKRVGAWGDVGSFSFYPTKNLGAIGDGGMVVTAQKELAEKMRMTREYGWNQDRISQRAGWNTRLDELQAAILRVKLRCLDQDNEKRRTLASWYQQGLAPTDLILPKARAGARHVYHLYVVRTSSRDRLRELLTERQIQSAVHYPVPVHDQPGYRQEVKLPEPLVETEKIVSEIVSLPIYPELSQGELEQVVSALQSFVVRGNYEAV